MCQFLLTLTCRRPSAFVPVRLEIPATMKLVKKKPKVDFRAEITKQALHDSSSDNISWAQLSNLPADNQLLVFSKYGLQNKYVN